MFRALVVSATMVVASVSMPWSAAAGGEPPLCEGREPTIVGTPFADQLEGTPGDDVVWLGGVADEPGNDEGRDVYLDDEGDDLVCQGATGRALVITGGGDDVVVMEGYDGGYDRWAEVRTGPGADRIEGGPRTRHFGGPGADELVAAAAHGAPGDGCGGGESFSYREELYGGSGPDTLTSGAGGDYLDGGDGDDTVDAGGGEDVLVGTPGDDTLGGGDDACADTLHFSPLIERGAVHNGQTTQMSSGVTMDLTAEVVTSPEGSTSATGIECWIGTPYADTILGTDGEDCIDGGHGTGRDRVRAGGGDDWLAVAHGNVRAGDGDDVLWLDLGTARMGGGDDDLWASNDLPDFLEGLEHRKNELRGGDGNDTIGIGAETFASSFGGPGRDRFHFGQAPRAFADGGPGRDRLSHSDPTFLDVAARTSWTRDRNSDRRYDYKLTFRDLEVYRGSWYRDRLYGSNRDDVLDGREGTDLLVGRRGNDVLLGGPQRDPDDGLGTWDDVARGGPGRDTCDAPREHSCER